jgi:hypothetical protein
MLKQHVSSRIIVVIITHHISIYSFFHMIIIIIIIKIILTWLSVMVFSFLYVQLIYRINKTRCIRYRFLIKNFFLFPIHDDDDNDLFLPFFLIYFFLFTFNGFILYDNTSWSLETSTRRLILSHSHPDTSKIRIKKSVIDFSFSSFFSMVFFVF